MKKLLFVVALSAVSVAAFARTQQGNGSARYATVEDGETMHNGEKCAVSTAVLNTTVCKPEVVTVRPAEAGRVRAKCVCPPIKPVLSLYEECPTACAPQVKPCEPRCPRSKPCNRCHRN